MKDIFYYSPYQTHKKNNLFVPRRNTTKYGDKSLRVLGAHVWNSLPENVKVINSLSCFKEYMKDWFGVNCKCYMCKQ